MAVFILAIRFRSRNAMFYIIGVIHTYSVGAANNPKGGILNTQPIVVYDVRLLTL